MSVPYNRNKPVPRKEDKHLINGRITAPEVRLIGDNVEIPGSVMSLAAARRHAEGLKLDLVLVSPTATPPVCKVVDYKKMMFEESKREKEMNRKQKENNKELKEIRFTANIGENDVATKKKKIVEFITEGHKVKLTVVFRGRGINYSERGQVILLKIADELMGTAKPEALPQLIGKQMTMILNPTK